MGNKFEKFLLLMWKNFLLQWRHPVQTVVEILAPVAFASLLVAIRSLVDPEQHSATLYTPFKNSLPLNQSYTSEIAWSPINPTLVTIMDNVVKGLSEKNNGTKVKHRRFKDNQELEQYLISEFNLLKTLAGIQFDDSLAGNIGLSPNISFTLRFPAELRNSSGTSTSSISSGNWRTHQLFPTYQVGGPRDWKQNEGASPRYHLEGFLMLQQEVSFSIINHFKQNVRRAPLDDKAISIYMQRFPYPEWIQDDLLTALQSFVGLIIMLSFSYTCINTVKIITTEKEKQLKEAMKIMGLPNWLHWMAWYIKSFVFLLITVIIIVILTTATWYPGTDHTIFTHSNPLVIFLFLVFYISAVITFCFAISSFFSKANTAAAIAGMAWFLSYFPYSFLQTSYDTLSLPKKLLASLGANSAMAYGFQLMLMFEGTEEGLQWHNIWKTTAPDDNLVLGHLLIMLLLDTFIYLLIALYAEAVFPGEYGVPQVWYFPFTKSYWCGRPVEAEDLEEDTTENEFFEREPTNLEPGIKIKHLRKVFSNKKIAVKDLSLNMYKDQITVLLGHNGAGKTTTMSMLTGMFPPTSGTAIVGGYDIRTDMAGVRESLGLCPQHNILFDELTVKEHLYFYSRLKGTKKNDVNNEIEKYIKLLELSPKKDAQSQTLSGGMKRKLSVAVALCGDSKVVMCDEPTAGMDPAARRVLWDLLQSQKQNRTILLTTHYMDEADLLGDRIAIMAGGKLQCCGSSFFLKKKYGAGYHLIMDKTSNCDVQQVTNLLQKYIPNIQIESNIGSELSYLLPEDSSSLFEIMLSDLEIHSAGFGITSYGISLTTLEEVFMKVGADHGQDDESYLNEAQNEQEQPVVLNGYQEVSQVDPNRVEAVQALNQNVVNQHAMDTTVDLEEHFSTGCALWCNQFVAMLMKRGLSILRSWILLIIQSFIPIFFLILAIVLSRGTTKSFSDLPGLGIELATYDDPVTVMTQHGASRYADSYKNIFNTNGSTLLEWDGNMTDQMINETQINTPAVRQRYIVGATFEGNTSITAWFNNQPYHSPSLALQLVMNTIFQAEVDSEHSIQVNNHPLPFTLDTKLKQLDQGNTIGFQIAFNLGFAMAFVSAFYIMFYIKERACKAKHLQFVSGISVIPFWGASFICDLITFISTSILIIITLAIFQEDGFKTPEELGRIFSVLLYFAFAMLPMMYLASYVFDIPSTGYTRMAMINVFTGVAVMLIVQILSQPSLDLQNTADILHLIFLLVPHYSFSAGVRDMYVIYSTHNLCENAVDLCVNLTAPGIPHLTPARCKRIICERLSDCCTTTTNYYSIESPGIGKNVIYSICVGSFLIAVLLGIEFRFFAMIINKIRRSHPPPQANTEKEIDSDVLQEKLKIRNASMEEIQSMSLAMRDVTKYYEKFLAVNSLCLGVNRYECFGLLGVNGAGKTTTFKMMTGDISMSSGDAWVTGLNLKTDMKKVSQLIGYCPQFDALLDDLTCRETLIIFGLLRGKTMSESKLSAANLSQDLDFQRHLDKKVKELSGGNKRKLSTAVALIGNPLVVYLDEPTAGMDPATKRYLWDALCKVRDNGKCIVLTSHSMEECEALCTRLAIMVNGTFMCLGSTQHLKSKFSAGYTLTIKVRKSGTGELESSEWHPVEKFVKDNFHGATIREKHQELITFYIADKSLPWSTMFGIMERGKMSLNIEDYSLGQSSLEQVFLSFTKYQREDEAS